MFGESKLADIARKKPQLVGPLDKLLQEKSKQTTFSGAEKWSKLARCYDSLESYSSTAIACVRLPRI